jgi:hypothetical protein
MDASLIGCEHVARTSIPPKLLTHALERAATDLALHELRLALRLLEHIRPALDVSLRNRRLDQVRELRVVYIVVAVVVLVAQGLLPRFGAGKGGRDVDLGLTLMVRVSWL